nr:hypothetical protein [Clostridioides difficile]
MLTLHLKKVDYVRIGEQMKVEMAVLEYCGDKEAYLKLIYKKSSSYCIN